MAPSSNPKKKELKNKGKGKVRSLVEFRLESGITVGYPRHKLRRRIHREHVRNIPSLLSLRVPSGDPLNGRDRERLRHHRAATRSPSFRRERDSSRPSRESSIDRDRRQREYRNKSPTESRRITNFARQAYRRHMGTSSSSSNRNQAILAERTRARMLRRDNEKMQRRTRVNRSDGHDESHQRHERDNNSTMDGRQDGRAFRMNNTSHVPKRRFNNQNQNGRRASSDNDHTRKRKSIREFTSSDNDHARRRKSIQELTSFENRRQERHSTSAPYQRFDRRPVASGSSILRPDLRREPVPNRFSTRPSVIVKAEVPNNSLASEAANYTDLNVKREALWDQEQETYLERDPRLQKRSYESYFPNPDGVPKVNSSETVPANREEAHTPTVLTNLETYEQGNVPANNLPVELASRDTDMGSIAAIYMSLDTHQQQSIQRELSRVYLEHSLKASKTYKNSKKNVYQLRHEPDSSTESDCESLNQNSFTELSIEDFAAIVASDNKLTSTFFSKLESLQADSMKSYKGEQLQRQPYPVAPEGSMVPYNRGLAKPATSTNPEQMYDLNYPYELRQPMGDSLLRKVPFTPTYAPQPLSKTFNGIQRVEFNFPPGKVTRGSVPGYSQNTPGVNPPLPSTSSARSNQCSASSIPLHYTRTPSDEELYGDEAETEYDDELDIYGVFSDDDPDDEHGGEKYGRKFPKLGSEASATATSVEKIQKRLPNATATSEGKMQYTTANDTLEGANTPPQCFPTTPKKIDIATPGTSRQYKGNRKLQTSDHSIANLLKPSGKRNIGDTGETSQAQKPNERPDSDWKTEKLMEPKSPQDYLANNAFEHDYAHLELSMILDPRIRKTEAIRRGQFQQEQEAVKNDKESSAGLKKLIEIEKEKYTFGKTSYEIITRCKRNMAGNRLIGIRGEKLPPLPTAEEMEHLVRTTLETSPFRVVSPIDNTNEEISKPELTSKLFQTLSSPLSQNAQGTPLIIKSVQHPSTSSGTGPVHVNLIPIYPKVQIPEIDLSKRMPSMASMTPKELKEKHGALVELMGIPWIKDQWDDEELRRQEDAILNRPPNQQWVPHEGLRAARLHEEKVRLRRTLYFQCVDLLGTHGAVYKMMSEEDEIRREIELINKMPQLHLSD